jgi:hypothetical protein
MGGVSNRERWDVLDADAASGAIRLRRVGNHKRVVSLGPDYLDRRTANGDPALE